jgi:4-amino-4-deoxy-L-arabinose transferase-like glycosyltransferase
MLRAIIKKYPLLIILCSAFLIRVIYFAFVILRNPEGIYVFDSYGYWQISFNVREYGIFSQSYNLPLEPDYYRTPLYPLFIIAAELVGPEGFSIIAFQILLAVLICWLTYKLAMLITGSYYISLVSALIIACDVPSVVMNTLVMTETLFTFLLLGTLYLFLRYLNSSKIKLLVLSSVCCGLAVLCRPIGFFVPVLLMVFLLFNFRKKLKSILLSVVLYGVVSVLTISPWLIRNKVAFKHFFLSVIREHDMQNYQAAAIYAELHHRQLPESQSILRWKTFKDFQGDAASQPYEYAKFIEADAFKLMIDNPGILIKHHAVQFAHFFLKPCRAYIDIQLGNWGQGYNTIPKDYPIFKYLFEHNSKLTIILVFFQLLCLLIIYLSLIPAGMFFHREKKFMYFLFLGLVIFCFANLTLPYVTESRFRVPVMPYIAILSASGIYFLREKFRKKINEKIGSK